MHTAPAASPTPAAIARSQGIGLFLAALGAALFATKGIFVKLGLAGGLDTLTMLTWRMLLAVPVFVVVGWLGVRQGRAKGRAPIRPRTVLAACGVGALGYYVASYLDFTGLQYVSAQFNRLILLTYPFFVLLLGALFFGKRLSLPAVVAALVAYCGIAVIFAHDLVIEGEQVLLGAALVLGSAIAYAFYQLISKPLIDALGAQLFTSIAMSAAGVLVVTHFLFAHSPAALALAPNELALMIGLALVATVLPAYAISVAIGRIGPERTAIFGNVSPLVTIVLAVGLLGENFTLYHGFGTALVISGILLFTHLTRRRKEPANPAA